MDGKWRLGPFGLDAAKGTTLTGRRTVLVVVHHVTAGTRLADVVPLLESDRRIQVVYTASPASTLSVGVEKYLQGLGGIVIPYRQAIRMAFDLALAAGDGLLQQLHAPILTLPHGVAHGVLAHRWQGHGPATHRPMAGLHPESISAGGRIIPSAIAVSHESHLTRLAKFCPEALPIAVVAGDPALDRLVASIKHRATYRQALGVGPEQRLIVVSSTWGPRSLLGRHDDLLIRLASALPRHKYRIVAALHPNIWCWHGFKQVNAWFEDCREAGVLLLPCDSGWQAALAGADRVIGDYGSVTCYAAAIGVPTLLATFPDDDAVPGSEVALLGEMAPRLELNGELEPQIAACVNDGAALLHSRLTSRPGQSARILRQAMYGLLGLPEPVRPPRVQPVSIPYPARASI